MKVIAWALIGLWLTRSMIFNLLKIDFISLEVARDVKQIWMILIPLAIGTLIVKSWKESTSILNRIIDLSLVTFVSIGLIIVLNFLSGFCGWQFSEPLYKHKFENTTIRERILDCGAYDSDPTYQLVITNPIGRYLIKYSIITKEDIDGKDWIKE